MVDKGKKTKTCICRPCAFFWRASQIYSFGFFREAGLLRSLVTKKSGNKKAG